MFSKYKRIGVLGDIADIQMGQSPNGSTYNTYGRGMIFFQGRTDFGFRFPSIRQFTSEPKCVALQNDILMSVRAPVGDVNIAHEKCCIGRGLASIRSKNNYQSFMLYLMFSVKKYLDVFNSEGTVFGSINTKTLLSLPVIVPSFKEIEIFEELVSPIDDYIRSNHDETKRLKALRDTLLPKLMSGEIDVSKVEI